MTANALGTVVSGLAALLFIILALATFRARRSDRRAYNLAAVRATNVAALRWSYEVQALAAIRGWTLPELPREMTPDYLMGRAQGEDNPELAKLADLATGMMPKTEGTTP